MTSSLALAGPPRSRPNSIPHWFPQAFVEKIALKASQPSIENNFNEGDFLIPHDVKKIKKIRLSIFYWYKSVNGVQPER